MKKLVLDSSCVIALDWVGLVGSAIAVIAPHLQILRAHDFRINDTLQKQILQFAGEG